MNKKTRFASTWINLVFPKISIGLLFLNYFSKYDRRISTIFKQLFNSTTEEHLWWPDKTLIYYYWQLTISRSLFQKVNNIPSLTTMLLEEYTSIKSPRIMTYIIGPSCQDNNYIKRHSMICINLLIFEFLTPEWNLIFCLQPIVLNRTTIQLCWHVNVIPSHHFKSFF